MVLRNLYKFIQDDYEYTRKINDLTANTFILEVISKLDNYRDKLGIEELTNEEVRFVLYDILVVLQRDLKVFRELKSEDIVANLEAKESLIKYYLNF